MIYELSRVRHEAYSRRLRQWHRLVLDEVVVRAVTQREFEQMEAAQGCHPVLLAEVPGERTYWWYADRFYRGDAGLSPDAVRTLVFAAHLRRREQVDRADGIPRIAPDVLLEVWDRDAGSCAECGSISDLRFDRRGRNAASEAESLRLVCAGCAHPEPDPVSRPVALPHLPLEARAELT
jgi:hypothetical protein